MSAAARRDSIRALIDDSNLFDIARNSVASPAVIRSGGLWIIVAFAVPMRPDRIL